MPDRDAQTVALSRQSILVVTGVGVGLLTLVFVLGVQVGKQTAALRAPRASTSGEALTELPAPLAEQLKPFEHASGAGRTEEPRPAARPADDKPEAKAEPRPEAPAERWSLQLVSTSDEAEARRVAEKAKAAGVATTTVKEKGQHKVRLAKPGPKADMDALAKRLKAKGLDSFAVKAE